MSTEHPETLGPYRLESEIGSGGMGAVFKAYDTRLDRRVAIKRILASTEEDRPDARKRFLREARTAARLSHPTIVQVHDLFNDQGQDWIVMELIDGRSLAELLRHGPLPIPRVLDLGREVAEGLAHAHRQGTIHRDLKAENVMLTPEGHAKILDFGLAKRVWQDSSTGMSSSGEGDASLTASGAVLGTFRAMSPEQARGFEIGPASDLFSLGTLLYEMASATRPFAGRTPLDTLTRVCSYQPPSLDAVVDGVPERFCRLVDELLRKEPSRRPESAEEVAQTLAAMSSSQIEAPIDPLSDRRVATRRSIERSEAGGSWSDQETEPAIDFFKAAEAKAAVSRPPSERIDSRPESSASPSAEADPDSGRRGGNYWVAVVGAVAVIAVLMMSWSMNPSEGPSTHAETSAAPALSVPELLSHGRRLLTTYYRQDDLSAAILAFEQVLDRQPESASAYAGLSRAFWRRYYSANRDPMWLERALSHGSKAVELDPFLVDARVSQALALVFSGRLEDAESEIEAIQPLDPSNADLHRVAAEIAKARGQPEEAVTEIRLAIELADDDFDFYNFLGSRLMQLGRSEEAIDCFVRSIELAPESIVAYRNLAGVYYRQGKISEAAKWMQKALEIRPAATLYASLGILYFDQGLYREATSVFEKAVDVPGGGNDYRVWGNLADAYRWTPDHDAEARDAYGHAIHLLRESKRQDAGSRSRLALFLAKRGDLEAARRELAALDETELAEPDILYRIAVAQELLGERARALESLAAAVEAGYSMEVLKRDPELGELRADADFHRQLARLN